MKGSHIHVGVKDFRSAVNWMDRVLKVKAVFSNDRMAVFHLGPFSVIVDEADYDTTATIALDSEDCQKDFDFVVQNGADVIEKPAKQHWGVIAAYFKGPGQLTFEIEQVQK
ncbi:MAG: VOC family protein [Bdellovibrionota bacterium]